MTGLRAAVRLNRRNGLQCRASLFSRPRTCRSCAAIMFLRYKDRCINLVGTPKGRLTRLEKRRPNCGAIICCW